MSKRKRKFFISVKNSEVEKYIYVIYNAFSPANNQLMTEHISFNEHQTIKLVKSVVEKTRIEDVFYNITCPIQVTNPEFVSRYVKAKNNVTKPCQIANKIGILWHFIIKRVESVHYLLGPNVLVCFLHSIFACYVNSHNTSSKTKLHQ
jgi:hypothetical protein